MIKKETSRSSGKDEGHKVGSKLKQSGRKRKLFRGLPKKEKHKRTKVRAEMKEETETHRRM